MRRCSRHWSFRSSNGANLWDLVDSAVDLDDVDTVVDGDPLRIETQNQHNLAVGSYCSDVRPSQIVPATTACICMARDVRTC